MHTDPLGKYRIQIMGELTNCSGIEIPVPQGCIHWPAERTTQFVRPVSSPCESLLEVKLAMASLIQ